MNTRTVNLRDGTACFVRFTLAGPRGTVLVVHGALEHGEYYEELAGFLASHGWSVVIPDLRGLGRSGGTRMHVGHFDDYLSDLDEVLTESAPGSGTAGNPLVVFGHSMGGLIGIRYAQTRPDKVAGLILSAPLLKVALKIHPWVLAIGWQLSRIFPRLKFRSGIRSEHLSRNQEYLELRRRDPLVRGRVTAGWFRAAQAAMQAAQVEQHRFEGPVLLLQGIEDRVTQAQAALEWAELAHAEIHRLPDQRHALLQEPERQASLQIIRAWLDRHVGADALDGTEGAGGK